MFALDSDEKETVLFPFTSLVFSVCYGMQLRNESALPPFY